MVVSIKLTSNPITVISMEDSHNYIVCSEIQIIRGSLIC